MSNTTDRESFHEDAETGGASLPPAPLSPTERQRIGGNEAGTATGSDASGSIVDPNDPPNRLAHEQPDANTTPPR